MNYRMFVVDIGEDRTHSTPSLRLWGVDEKGQRVLVRLSQLKPYFYFVSSTDDILTVQNSIAKIFPNLSLTIQLRRRLGREVKVLKISCPDYKTMDECVKYLRKKATVHDLFEDDLRLSVRYTTDLDLTPSSWIEGAAEPGEEDEVKADRVLTATAEPRRIELEKPTLRMMAFDVLTLGTKGSAKPDRDPIRAIAVATDKLRPEVKLAEKDDEQILSWFIQTVNSVDPDVLVGFNSNRVQWLYLLERCKVHNLKMNIGRDSSEPRTSSYGHISVAGRATLDLFDYANGLVDLKIKDLNTLAEYLQDSSAESVESVDDLELASSWKSDDGRRRLIRNTTGKAVTCLRLGRLVLPYAIQLSALTRLPLDEVMTAAVGFRVDSYLLRPAHLKEELIPRRTEQPFSPYRGAIVLEPQPGLHENIVVLDFASMYPNLMRKYNLSPDTLIHTDENVPPEEAFIIPEVKHRFRKKPDGLYRLALSDLLDERASIKKELLKLTSKTAKYTELAERERAIKVIANACYGYAGWRGARWYVIEVAESATALGRQTITQTVSKAMKLGLEVIYGDTDSIFVQNRPEKIERLLGWARSELGLEVRPERTYSRLLFTEAMKRYAGLGDDGSLDIVGLEVVRGDWSDIAKQVQSEVLVSVLRNRSIEEAIEQVKCTIHRIRGGEFRISELVIRKNLTKSVSDYAVRAPHVEVAKKLLKEGWDFKSGDQVAYVIVKGPGKLYEKAEPYTRVSSDQIDVDYYVANQIMPAAMRVLSILGVKERQLEV